ncbi:MAG TPA: DUF4386 domain-containing protein [Thermoanaerobaculia bacterium]|nr:DUF4386 domain-containing protein [Thermoanaerobaculia bacterium]
MKIEVSSRVARTAGFLYLIVVITGIFSIAYVPSRLIVPGDAAATLSNITASEPLFRLGIVAGYLCYTAFLLLPFALYKLLGSVRKDAAVLMVAFAVVSVPISFVNLLHNVNIVALLSRPELRVLSQDQLRSEVLLSLAAYGNGLLVSKIFWGLWLLPFGYLVFKSGILPRVLGVLLMAGCVGYVVAFVCGMLMPGYGQTALARFVSLPATIGEIGTALWLLIMGIRQPANTHSPGRSLDH